MTAERDETGEAERIKNCCASLYENDLLGLMFGDSFHPGGLALTVDMGKKMGLDARSTVLDVACGSGASAVGLSEQFGCRVTGTDLSQKNLEKAEKRAASLGLADKLDFVHCDAERLSFDEGTFDALICECALCTFPDTSAAVSEMHRVLKRGAKIGITDVVVEGPIPDSWKTTLATIACIGGARSASQYTGLLSDAGFESIAHEDRSETLWPLLEKVESLVGVLPALISALGDDMERTLGFTQESAQMGVARAFEEIENGRFGYGLFTGLRP